MQAPRVLAVDPLPWRGSAHLRKCRPRVIHAVIIERVGPDVKPLGLVVDCPPKSLHLAHGRPLTFSPFTDGLHSVLRIGERDMLEWLHTFGIDVKGIITAVVGAFVGAVFKWMLDRKEKAQLQADINTQKTVTETLGQRLETTHVRLAEQETANATKQRELDRLSELLKGKGIDIQEREDRLTKLLATLRDSDTSMWAKFQKQLPFTDYDARIGRWSRSSSLSPI